MASPSAGAPTLNSSGSKASDRSPRRAAAASHKVANAARSSPQLSRPYIGRFAPSPTGSLHFGSAVAAIASYLDAHTHDGEWRVRIDDLDTARTVAGAADEILLSLEQLGLEWHGPVIYQSTMQAEYAAAIEQLVHRDSVYPCSCTRKTVRGGPYPGTCRAGPQQQRTHYALRVRVPAGEITFDDALAGRVSADVAREFGDFIVCRADGIVAYHLATVLDDHRTHISHVVRGADLLPATGCQRYLYELFNWPPPRYAHLPVATDRYGRKLSKQTRARPLRDVPPRRVLLAALNFLGFSPPAILIGAPLTELLNWATGAWSYATMRAAPIPQIRAANIACNSL